MPDYEIDTADVYVLDQKVSFGVRLYTEEDHKRYSHTDHGGGITVGVPYEGDRGPGGTATLCIPLDAFDRFVYEHYGLRVSSKFMPDWASSPAGSINDALMTREMTVEEAAERMGLAPETVKQLLADQLRITPDIAERLARITCSKKFWLRREADYLQSLARLAHKAADEAGSTDDSDTERSSAKTC